MGNRRFGFECELTSGAQSVIAALHSDDLAGMDSLHSYHCRCDDCRHNDVEADGGYLFRGQNDCTVDGEIITSILTHGTASADRAFSSLAKTLIDKRASVDENAGFHVHVDKTDLTDVDRLRLYRMFMRYQNDGLDELASAKERGVRSYNSPVNENYLAPDMRSSGGGVYFGRFYLAPGDRNRPRDYRNCSGRTITADATSSGCCRYCDNDIRNGYVQQTIDAQAEWDRLFGPDAVTDTNREPTPVERFWTDDTFVANDPGKSYWLNGYGAGNGNTTVEFRLWNATRVEWRMRLAVGVSVAMVDAAKAGVNVTKDDPRTLEEVLDPYLSDDTWAAIIRQRSFKD